MLVIAKTNKQSSLFYKCWSGLSECFGIGGWLFFIIYFPALLAALNKKKLVFSELMLCIDCWASRQAE